MLRIPHHPLLMARFGLTALQSAQSFARSHFSKPRTRAVFAGLAGHSFLSFDQPLSAAIGLMFAITIHAVGWPIPRGGAQAIPDALIAYLKTLGGTVHTSRRIDAAAFRELEPDNALVLFDTAPRQLLAIAGERLTPDYRQCASSASSRGRERSRSTTHCPQPVPWRATDCCRAITIHLGGTFEEIADSEYAVAHGRCAERPFVLAAQPTLFDPSRAPERKHVLWAYCHVPNGSTFDMTDALKRRLSALRRDFVIASWRGIFPRRRSWNRWMRTSSAATSAAAHDDAAVAIPADPERLRDQHAESLSLFGVDAAGRRRSRHVRLPCRAVGAAANEKMIGERAELCSPGGQAAISGPIAWAPKGKMAEGNFTVPGTFTHMSAPASRLTLSALAPEALQSEIRAMTTECDRMGRR